VIGGAVSGLTAVAGVAPKLANLLPATIRLARNGIARPFSAARTPTMGAHITPARSFAALDLPLDEVKRLAKDFGGTVNDIVLSICDDGMHRYLAETGYTRAGRMVSVIALSTRAPGDASVGNDVVAALVALGNPNATPTERLTEVIGTTKRLKTEARRPSASLPMQLETMLVLVSLEMREDLPIARDWVPNVANLLVSNLPAGPEQPLFFGHAKLAGFYVAPLVPPATAANFTVMSYGGLLCMGIGAARNLIPDTARLAELTTKSFAELSSSAQLATVAAD
jgi:hypothetical protein